MDAARGAATKASRVEMSGTGSPSRADANAHQGDVPARAAHDPAALGERVDRGGQDDHDVAGLAGLHAPRRAAGPSRRE